MSVLSLMIKHISSILYRSILNKQILDTRNYYQKSN